uniref:Uncharacterized protein n=1 Tax=Ceratitis capitata TaxID=7213 RepID=W8BJA8_CERCA
MSFTGKKSVYASIYIWGLVSSEKSSRQPTRYCLVMLLRHVSVNLQLHLTLKNRSPPSAFTLRGTWYVEHGVEESSSETNFMTLTTASAPAAASQQRSDCQPTAQAFEHLSQVR